MADIQNKNTAQGMGSDIIPKASPEESKNILVSKEEQEKEPPEENEEDQEPQEKKMVGLGFFFMLFLALFKDALDFGTDFSIILSWLSFIAEPLVLLLFYFYYKIEGVSFDKKKTVTMVVTFVIGFIPFLSALPETTVNLFVIRWLENSPLAKDVLAKVTRQEPEDNEKATEHIQAQPREGSGFPANQQPERGATQEKSKLKTESDIDSIEPNEPKTTPSPVNDRNRSTSETKRGHDLASQEERSVEEEFPKQQSLSDQNKLNPIKRTSDLEKREQKNNSEEEGEEENKPENDQEGGETIGMAANFNQEQGEDLDRQQITDEMSQHGIEDIETDEGNKKARVLDIHNPKEADLDQYTNRKVA